MLDDQRLPGALLAYLRESFGVGSLDYGARPTRVLGGYDTTIYTFELRDAPAALSGPMILRLFQGQNQWLTLSTADRARFDSIVQNTVHGLGYPAPRAIVACPDAAPLGASFVVMERIPGKLMLELFFRPSPLLFRLPKLLSRAQARLHDLDSSSLLRSLEAGGFSTSIHSTGWLERIGEVARDAGLEGLAPGIAWLRDNAPAPAHRDVICHGDFHPLNILVERGQVSGVIDWSWARLGEAEYDVGATIALFRQGPLRLPPFVRGLVDRLRNWFIARYVAEYKKLRHLDMALVDYHEALRCLGFLTEAGAAPNPSERSPFGQPAQVRHIAARVRELTGTTVSLPS